MSNSRPTGSLMTGAIGSIFFSIAWLLMIGSFMYVMAMVTGGGVAGAGTSEGLGGLMLLAVVLILAGGITQGIGYMGLKQMFGGVFMIAGLFDFLISLGIILAVVSGFIESVGLVKVSTYLLLFSLILSTLFGGIGCLGSRAKASNGQGPLMIAGACLVGSAAIFIIMYILALAEINVGITVGKILGYLWIFGTIVGHVGLILVMLGQRKGGAPAPAAAAA